MNMEKTFLQLSKEQTDPFKALYYEILSRFNSHDYDMAVSSMSEGLNDIIIRCKIQLECEAELLKGAREYIEKSDSLVKKLESSFAESLKMVNEQTKHRSSMEKQDFWNPEKGFFSLQSQKASENEQEIKEINARIKFAARQGAPISKISNGFHTFAHLFDCLDAFVVAMIKQMAVLEHRPTFGRYTTGDLWIKATLPTIAKAHSSVCFLVGAKHEKAIRRFAEFSHDEIEYPNLDENITKLITAFYVINDLL